MSCNNESVAPMEVTTKSIQLTPRMVGTVEEDGACKFVHPSFNGDGNLIVQFINHNCHDSATVIGGIRLKVTEAARIPTFIAQIEGTIKTHAIACLKRHILENQCPVGTNEALTQDDFSLSFMIASLSPRGMAMHPSGRHEGPLFYCLFNTLVEDICLSYVEMDQEPPRAYVVNAYIHLVDTPRRRSHILKKQKEERKKLEAAAAASTDAAQASNPPNTQAVPAKKANKPFLTQMNSNPNRRPPYQFGPPQTAGVTPADLQKMTKNILGYIQTIQPNPSTFPVLPQTSMQWPTTDNLPDLPEDK